jgi:hypothetical protein
MAPVTEVPGLIGITEEPIEGGGMRLVFEIEDGKETEFYAAFGLQVDDAEGFQRILIEALEMMLGKQRTRDAQEER